jgi:DNA-binding response OmpR family regulator
MATNAVLIDDDPDDLDILKEQIRMSDAGIHCLTFQYAKEAVRVLSDELILIPNYIFTDINMPDMRGEEVVRTFRSIKDFDDTTIVVLSTSMPDRTHKYLKDLGADYAFAKPTTLSDYGAIIKEVLGSFIG